MSRNRNNGGAAPGPQDGEGGAASSMLDENKGPDAPQGATSEAPVNQEPAVAGGDDVMAMIRGLQNRMDQQERSHRDELDAAQEKIRAANDRLGLVTRRAEDAEEKLDMARRAQGLPGELSPTKFKEGVDQGKKERENILTAKSRGKYQYAVRISNLHPDYATRVIGTDFEGDEHTRRMVVKSIYEDLIGSRGTSDPDGKGTVAVLVEPVDPETAQRLLSVSL